MSLRDITIEGDDIIRVWLERTNWKPFEDESRKVFCAWLDDFNERQQALKKKKQFGLHVVTAQLRGGDDWLPLVANPFNHGCMGIGAIMDATFRLLMDELDPPDLKELRTRIDDTEFNHGVADIMGVKEE
jgi:hypothetical protein